MKIALVDNEAESLDLLKGFLKQYQEERKLPPFVIAAYSNGAAFLEAFDGSFDLVFMDIEMPLMDGLTAAKQMRLKDPSVLLIFVTKMAQFAVNGYEVNAMDFMVKPIGYFNFAFKLDKARRTLEERKAQDYYLLHLKDGVKKIAMRDIHYVEVWGHTLCFHCSAGVYLERVPLSEFEKKVTDKAFVRSNKCYLINLAYLKEIKASTAVIDNEELDISRSRKKAVMDAFAAYLGSK
jgi:two-component system, LytTR family, response regulator LytT